jgi:hypothetical protein
MPVPNEIDALRAAFRKGLRLVAAGTRLIGQSGLRLAWLGVRRLLGIVFALILLFEQWGWQPLSDALARLARLAPIAALERHIARLPPYAALVTFALPSALLVPLKLLALYLIANGHAFTAGALFVGAKIVGTAIVARLYQLTSPQLMQIGWVKRAHDVLLPRLHDAHEAIRQSWAWRVGRVWKFRVKRSLQPVVLRLRARFVELIGLSRAPHRD